MSEVLHCENRLSPLNATTPSPSQPPVASLTRLLGRVGIDRAIGFTILGRGWASVAGFVNLFLLTRLLSSDQQGFYYTFGSVLGLTIFFELGLGYVLIQFASHEYARLSWSAQGTLEGDAVAKLRLSSLLRRSLIWYAVLGLLVTISLIPIGLLFFGIHAPHGVHISWQLPWVWVVAVTVAAMMIGPLYTILEGAGLITEIVTVQAVQGFVASLFGWTGLLLHGGLCAAPLGNTAALLVGAGWLWLKKRGAIRDLLTFPARCDPSVSAKIDWRREIWPFQWKIAISGITSYFIFQMFNPILFAARGATAAGRMGLCINVMTAIGAVSMGWISTKSATFGAIIARRDYRQLDRLFFPCLWQSLTVVVIGGVSFWSAAFYLHHIHHRLAARLLDPVSLGFLVATVVMNHVVIAQALYLRAHKQEPLLWLSIAGAVSISLGGVLVAKPFGAAGLMFVYFLTTLLFGLVGVTAIFVRKRREWHADAPESLLSPSA